MYGIAAEGDDTSDAGNIGGETDIEAEIDKEVRGLRSAKKEALFRAVKIDIMCGKLTALFQKNIESDEG